MSVTDHQCKVVCRRDLLERLVVDKACRIFWNVQLAFLELFTKLPTVHPIRSGFSKCRMASEEYGNIGPTA